MIVAYQLNHYVHENLLAYVKAKDDQHSDSNFQLLIKEEWSDFHLYDDHPTKYDSDSVHDFIQWFNERNENRQIEQIIINIVLI